MFKVLIDTNAYEALQLSFKGTVFDSLAQLATHGKIKLYMSDVIKREVESHLKDAVRSAVNDLKEAINKTRNFSIDSGELAPFAKRLTTEQKALKESIYATRKANLDSFIQAAAVEVMPSNGVDLAQVMADYFDKKPPFGEGKKKDEFPDAFALQKFLSLTNGDTPWYIVSNDDGWADFAAANRAKLKCVKTISAFLDEVNQHFETLSATLHTLIDANEDKVMEVIKAEFAFSGFYIDSFINADIELNDAEVEIEIDEIDLIAVTEGRAEWGCRFVATYKLSVSADDPDSGYKDPDTKEWIYVGRNGYELNATSILDAIVVTLFDDTNVQDSFVVDVATISESTIHLDEDEFEVEDVTDWHEEGPDW